MAKLTEKGEELMKGMYANTIEEMTKLGNLWFPCIPKKDVIEALNICGKYDECACVEMFLDGMKYQKRKSNKGGRRK